MNIKSLFSLSLLTCSISLLGQNGFKSKEKVKQDYDTRPSVTRNVNGGNDSTLVKSRNNKLSKRTKTTDNELKISRSYKRSANDTPTWLEVNNPEVLPTISSSVDQSKLSSDFLKSVKHKMQVSDNSGFVLIKNNDNSSRFIQQYKGIEIYGSEVIVHINSKRQAYALNGSFHSCSFNLDTNTVLKDTDILPLAIEDIKQHASYQELTEEERDFLRISPPITKKIIFPLSDSEYRMAYEVSIHSNILDHWSYVIDANDGSVLNKYNQLCSAGSLETAVATDLKGISQTINTYLDESGDYFLADATKPMFNAADETGLILTLDAKNTSGNNPEYITSSNNIWNNRSAISAHTNAGIAYDYFYDNHNRNSLDGNGGEILSIVNVTDEFGNDMDNAYWNGRWIFYGNGDQAFTPLAGAVDVAGHEMSHGVVQNTANLVYQNEPGAINESMADIFGFMMDSTDWLIGEDVTKTSYIPSGALRNMQDPHNGGNSLADPGYQPNHVNEQFRGNEDNGGVHINSGIPNRAFYLLATDINSKSTAAQIFYHALTNYLTRSSDFEDLRNSCVQSAKDLYGENSSIVESVREAFTTVGILGSDQVVVIVDNEIETNDGEEYFLSLDTDPMNQYTLYHSSNTGTDLIPLTTTSITNKPSVTDDGSFVFFVTSDNDIHAINLSSINNVTEYFVDNSGIWDNVAISKDGTKYAAISTDIDSAIYVFDLTTGEGAKFTLFNPTFSEGVQSGGPLYADAIEWDYTGERLIYDAFNQVQTTGGEDIEYWDVGIISVWDNEANDFGNGEIEKLFASLPEDVSIGNPSFSKNSNNIIAFDYFDFANDDYAIIGYDIEKNDLSTIYENNTIGWPSYNRTDDRVAFTTDQFGISTIIYTELNDDKINSNGTGDALISYAALGSYYSVGERIINPTGLSKKNDHASLASISPNPFNDVIIIDTDLESFKTELSDLKGRLIKESTDDKKINTSELDKGIYILKIYTEKAVQTFKILKE